MRMRQYKHSGIPWMKQIPENWSVVRGKDFLYLMSRPVREDDDVVTCFRDGEVVLRSERRTEGFTMSDKEIGYQGINKGDIVIHGMDGFAGAMGVSKSTGKGSPVLIVCNPKSDDDARFVIYYLRSLAMNNVFVALATGIRERSCDLRWNKISVLPFVRPPFTEQKKIADFIDMKSAEIDSLIALQEQMIEKLKAYRQSVITEAVTKGLDPNAKLVPSGIDWIGEIPEGWKVTPLKWILRKPLQYGANESGILYDDSLPRYVRITDILNNNLREDLQKQSLTEEQAKGYILEDDDILFARSGGTVGKAFIYKSKYGRCAFAGYLIRAQINNQNDSKFIYYYTQSSSYDEWKKQIFIQSTIQNIGADRYSTLEIPIPPLSEQHSIASYLDAKCSDIDRLIALKQQKIEALKNYKKSVIYEAVTGKTEI